MGWGIGKIGNWLTVLLFISHIASASLPGGDGPTPFEDIDNFPVQVDVLPAVGGVQEFVYWERRNTVLYRNDFNELRGLDLARHLPYFMSRGVAPLLDIVDPVERFIATQDASTTYLFDALANPPQWYPAITGGKLEPAFWKGNTFYAAGLRPSGDNLYRLDVYDYDLRNGGEQTCSVEISSPEPVKLATGHNYPYVYFYSTRRTAQGQVLFLSGLNVERGILKKRKCNVTADLLWNVEFPAPIESVHRFPENSVAVKLNHPKLNLYWQNSNDAVFYNIGNLAPLVVNRNNPTIATWTQDLGLTLYYLNFAQKASLMAGYPIESVRAQDIRMSSDGRKLIFAPALSDQNSRWVMNISLGEPVTRQIRHGHVLPTTP